MILAGGQGKRFMDRNNTDVPKQFFKKSLNEPSMLERTFDRLYKLKMQLSDTMIITQTKEAYAGFLKQAKLVGQNEVFFEPADCGNTGPAIFHSIYKFVEQFGESVFAFFPVDHEFESDAAFVEEIERLLRLAERTNKLFVLGTEPDSLSSELGYLNFRQVSSTPEHSLQIYPVQCFVEKPESFDLLLKENLLVNMGVVIGKGSVFLESFILSAAKKQGKPFQGNSFDKEVLEFCSEKMLASKCALKWKDAGI